MIITRWTLSAIAGVLLAAFPGPWCHVVVPVLQAQEADRPAQAPDSATVRLHISGMTCGTCPTTARLALTRLPGVYSATVTLDDSLGTVRYDARRVRPDQIAAHLTQLTGYRATILPDSARR